MKVVFFEKGKYIFLDADIPEIREHVQEISAILENVLEAADEKVTEVHENINYNPDTSNRLITLETLDSEVVISTEEIVSVEVYRNNCTVYTRGNNYKLKRGTLENTLKEIGDNLIVRCHKSYGINVRWLEGWKKKDRNIWEPIYREEIEAPCLISKTYYDQLQITYLQFHHSDKIANMQK